MVTLAEELPFAAVVDNDHLDKTCSSCFSTKENLSRCIGCKVVHYCDKVCQKKDWVDHKRECVFLKSCSAEIPPPTCRLMARIAMKLKRPDATEPGFNGRLYEDLMDHRAMIKKDPERMMEFFSCANVLREKFVVDLDLLKSIYGKIKINSFGITDDNHKCGKTLYLGLSVHNHSCISDANVVFDGCKAILRSPDPNKIYSKDITVSYTERLCSNIDRQKSLQSLYYFTCTCARCSDPTLDFFYNSARSTCCPDSYCLLDPAAQDLACNKCGSISGITIKEAIAANKEVKVFADKDNLTFDVSMLIVSHEKFSKILSPFNFNLLLLNDRIVRIICHSDIDNPAGRKYIQCLLSGYKHYLTVGDVELSDYLRALASTMSLERPPTGKVLELFEEALAAFSVSHGPEHFRTRLFRVKLNEYRVRLQYYALSGKDILDFVGI